jgi:hypothetical protein
MDEVDYDINNYSIEDMKALLGVTDIFNTKQIYDTTNEYINLSVTKNNMNMANLFRDIQHFLIKYALSIYNPNANNPKQPQKSVGALKSKKVTMEGFESRNPDDWMSPVLDQPSIIQQNKLADRSNNVQLYDNNHVPMKSEQLGITNTYTLPVVQDKLNPTLKNSYNRFIVLDSQYRQGSTGVISTDYVADLSDIMNKVLSIRLYSIQIPYSWYVFDSNYLNNYFKIQLVMLSGTTNIVPIEITSGNYTVSELVTELNTTLTEANITGVIFEYIQINSKMTIKFSSSITYNTDAVTSVNLVFYEANWSATSGIPFSFNQTLGWYLGYRNIIYNDFLPNSTLTPEAVVDISGPRYVVLSIDDFNQNHINNGLVTITETSTHLKIPDYYQSSAVYSETVYGKTLEQSAEEVSNNVGGGNNILNYADKMGTSYKRTQLVGVGPDGKQTLTQSQIYTINEILKNNSITTNYRNLAPTTPDVLAIIPVKPGISGELYVDFSGSLQENKRVYFGPVDIERLKIRLYNDRGQILDLNGLDWSFTLCAELLYQY